MYLEIGQARLRLLTRGEMWVMTSPDGLRYSPSMVRPLFAGSLLIGLLCAAQTSLADSVDEFLSAQREQHHIPGLAVTVVRGGKQIKTAALGMANLELQAPVTIDSRFEIGSITKQFTAAAILLLAQDGKL